MLTGFRVFRVYSHDSRWAVTRGVIGATRGRGVFLLDRWGNGKVAEGGAGGSFQDILSHI